MPFDQPTRTHLLRTAAAFVESYNVWTMSAIMAIRSPSCVHRILPEAYGIAPLPNAAYEAFLGPFIALFKNVEVVIVDEKETMVDVDARKVSIRMKGCSNTIAGEYRNEYIFILTMSEDGDLVDEVVEFLDSRSSNDFNQRMMAVMSKEAAGEGATTDQQA